MSKITNVQIKLIEEYYNDVVSHISYVKLFCKNLRIKNFTSNTPIIFSEKVLSVCEFLESILPTIYSFYKSGESDSEQKEAFKEILFTINEILKNLNGHIRFAQSAQTRFMPYSLIKSLENEITKIEPNVLILFRPQWSYDYTFRDIKGGKDFFGYYNNLIRSVYKSLSRKRIKIKNKSTKKKKKLFVVAFPSIERKNILLHCLLGHELGHVLFSAKNFINIDNFYKKASIKIRNSIEEEDFQTKDNLEKTKKINASFKYVKAIWERGFEEIFSDIIGTLLFGPSFLFAEFESIFQSKFPLDNLPNRKNKFYPPWRTRLRYIYNLCNELKFFPMPEEEIFQKNQNVKDNINDRIKLIKEAVYSNKDEDYLLNNKDKGIGIAYTQIFSSIEDSKKHLIKVLENFTFNPNNFYKKVEDLCDRIDNKITPNEAMNSQSGAGEVNLFEIIAAGWFYKIGFGIKKQDKLSLDEINSLTEINNRLILKAIEYSYLTKRYNNFLNRSK